jgi:transcription initiation factor TFIIB
MQALHRLSIESTTTDSPETSDEQTSEHTCDECGGDFRTGGDEVVCTDCGLVIDDEPIDHGPEWRTFDDSKSTEQKSRVGGRRTERRHDRGLGSEMGYDRDATGRKLKRLQRMKREESRGRFSSKKEQNLADGLGEVRRLCDRISASGSLTDRACRLFRVAHTDGVAIGHSLDALAAAATLAAIRDQSLPLPMSELLEYTDVNRRQAYKMLKGVYDVADVEAAPVEPIEHLPRIASGVDANEETAALAKELTLEAQERAMHSGCAPKSYPSAAVYIAGQMTCENFSQIEVAEAGGLCEMTIRMKYQELIEEGVVKEVTNVGR